MLVKFLLAFAAALFLTYPAAVLTTFIEGQSAQAIYSNHLFSSMLSYLLISLPFIPLLRNIKVKRPPLLLVMIILIYAGLVFWNLGRADILGDDYDLAYQAYNLQDGIQAARKAYVISFNTHPPLFMTIKHYWFQLFPNGLETVPAWGYRGMEGILGIATILAAYAIARDFIGKRAAIFTAAILAVNNYMVFLGRVFLREMYLTFFIILSIYFFQKKNYLITAFLVGCGLLIKTSAIVVLPVYLLILLYKKEFKNILKILSVIFIIYLPVFLYNFLAYVTTGHMDATFSKIFGLPHPFLTGSGPPLTNLILMKDYLADIYGWPIFLSFITATAFSLIRRQNIFYILILLSSLLYFVVAGPMREYYLLFLTIPFAILTIKLLNNRTFILSLFLVYSFWYTVSGQSAARKLYEPVRGWPELVSKVAKVYKVGDCLEKSGGVNDLAMRAYFQTDDTPKKMLLGSNYPHFYKMCDEVKNPASRIEILYKLPRSYDRGYLTPSLMRLTKTSTFPDILSNISQSFNQFAFNLLRGPRRSFLRADYNLQGLATYKIL